MASQESIDISVLLIIYKRPDATSQVFEQIRKAKPKRLYIAADGPKNIKDEEACLLSRQIATNVDWDCEVRTKFSDVNLNCGRGPFEAINWFFQHEEFGIILEDDCVPSLTFFPYCKELLEKYKNDQRVMMISGDNFLNNCNRDSEYSYFFSNFGLTWGWATWRRAWNYYDFSMGNYNEIEKKGYLNYAFLNEFDRRFRLSKFEKTYKMIPNIDWWDYQWQYTMLIQSGFCIVPEVNLIKNIGFHENATHTKNGKDSNGKTTICDISLPLKHPNYIMRDVEKDKKLLAYFIKSRIKAKISKYLHFF